MNTRSVVLASAALAVVAVAVPVPASAASPTYVITTPFTAAMTGLDQPYALALAPDGRALYTANFGGDGVSVFDAAAPSAIPGTVVDQFHPSLESPGGLALAPGGKTLYVTNFNFADPDSGVVSVVDTASRSVVSIIDSPGLNDPSGVAVTPDGKTLYVDQYSEDQVDIVDAATGVGEGSVPRASLSDNPVGITLSANGKRLYVDDYVGDSVSIVDTTTNRFIGQVADPGGSFDGPEYAALSPDGVTLYVANDTDNTISVVDTTLNTVTSVITDTEGTNFDGPTGVAVSPDGKTLYVTNQNADTISEVAIQAAPRGKVRIAGSVEVGVRLTAKTAGWDSGAHLSYQWKANGKTIKTATKPTFTPKAAQRGKKLTVTVAAHEAGYTPVTETSTSRLVRRADRRTIERAAAS
jgi:YVTN family beta-propeller protein